MSHRHWLWPLPSVLLCAAALISPPPAVAAFGASATCVVPERTNPNKGFVEPIAVDSAACNRVPEGEKWTVSSVWTMNTRFEQVPQGFATTFATPLADFRGKFSAVRFVIDAGSPYEREHFLANNAKLWIGEVPGTPGLPAADPMKLDSLGALNPGRHVVDVYWSFAAQHCDGLGADATEHCFPEGETQIGHIPFEVVSGDAVAP